MRLSKALLLLSVLALVSSQRNDGYAVDSHISTCHPHNTDPILTLENRSLTTRLPSSLVRRGNARPCEGRNGPNREACLKVVVKPAKLCQSCRERRAEQKREYGREYYNKYRDHNLATDPVDYKERLREKGRRARKTQKERALSRLPQYTSLETTTHGAEQTSQDPEGSRTGISGQDAKSRRGRKKKSRQPQRPTEEDKRAIEAIVEKLEIPTEDTKMPDQLSPGKPP